jgi:uncharacterized protein
MRRVSRVVPAPADLGLGGVVEVPEGTEIELNVRLEAVMEGVLASGTAATSFSGECVRCLDAVGGHVVVDVQELYAYPENEAGTEAGEDDLFVVEDKIDLEQPVRDAIVLALPSAPVCREDCPGLCAECGARLADDPSHMHDTTDPRWAALAELLTDDTNESGSSGAGPTEEK